MDSVESHGRYRATAVAAAISTVALDPVPADGRPGWVLCGFSGPTLPSQITDPRLNPERAGTAMGRWKLTCLEGEFEFAARGLEVHESRPELFDDLLARHALGSRDRFIVRGLLWLLRLPGGERLLRTWHARRT